MTSNGKRDQILIGLHVNDMDVLSGEDGITAGAIELCLSKAHLSVIPDDASGPYENDYTRCTAYQRYSLAPEWNENDFIPPTIPTSATTTETKRIDFESTTDFTTEFISTHPPLQTGKMRLPVSDTCSRPIGDDKRSKRSVRKKPEIPEDGTTNENAWNFIARIMISKISSSLTLF